MPDPLPRTLRRSQTEAERRLWFALRDRRLAGYKVRRQHPVGRYVVDFACPARRLVIEADGGQHDGDPSDQRRTEWLEAQGWQVLRFWNNDILENMRGVLETILRILEA